MAKTENPKKGIMKRVKELSVVAKKYTVIKEENYEQRD